MFAVVVTGAPGRARRWRLPHLSDALVKDRVAHAAVAVDEVAWAYPFPSVTQRCEHLGAWCAPHRRAGREVLLVAEVIESQEHLGDVLASLSAEDHLLVRLDPAPATLRQRIVGREPPDWSSLAWHLNQTPRIQHAVEEIEGVHLVIDSEQCAPAQIVELIRSARPDKISRGRK